MKKVIFILLGVVFLVVIVIIGLIFLFKNSISDVTVANISDTSATVIWKSSKQTHTEVYYQEEDSQEEKLIVYDKRDQIGKFDNYHLHYSEITDLKPETKYYYEIKNSGIKGFFTTNKISEDIVTPYPVYGTIEGNDIDEAIIIIKNKDLVYATLWQDKTNWSIDISMINEEDFDDYEVFFITKKGNSNKYLLENISKNSPNKLVY